MTEVPIVDSSNVYNNVEENRSEAQSDKSESSKRKREENEPEINTEVLVDHAKQIESVDNPVNANTNIKEDQTDEPVKKKKKQFVAKTNFVNGEFEDILETGWFYLDSYGKPQGPFSTLEMKQWYNAGFFFETTMVKRINEEEFVPISGCEEIKSYDTSTTMVSADIYSMGTSILPSEAMKDSYDVHNYNPYAPSYYAQPIASNSYVQPITPSSFVQPTVPSNYVQPSAANNYAQTAFFNTHNGRFAPVGNHFAAKGIPEDKAGRMLSHYLDVDSYQEAMRAAKNSEPDQGKVKVTKKMVNAFKKKKVEKQRNRFLTM